MMLESYNHMISVVEEVKDLWGNLKLFKKEGQPVDLMILGPDYSESDIFSIFKNEGNPEDAPPFIIISDTEKLNLIHALLDLGFYGYLIKQSDSMILMERVNTIFANIKKFK